MKNHKRSSINPSSFFFLNESLHRSHNRIKLLSFHSELLEIVDILVLALSGNFFDLETEVLEEFMHIYVPLKNKDAPSITT